MIALLTKEIRSFLSSIIGYVFMLIFLLMNGLFLWFFAFNTNVISGGYADLSQFFQLSPVVLIILIPAITMRSFSEEKRTGTIELLFTKPISDTSIVLSKFLAGVALVFLTLLPTLIYYISIHYMGDPVGSIDDGATITSYIGLLLMGCCFVSLGVFVSALTNSQIVAFILALFLCWFLFLGLDLVANYSQVGSLDLVIRNIGLQEHYESIQRGVLDTRDIVYFLSFISVFLYATYVKLQSRNW